ncbi:MAG: polysaccharide deacetylase family protein [Bacteroidetes bacterium]|nr:polysaccharide deacetylase family protein [Bacteroidota bacterium]
MLRRKAKAILQQLNFYLGRNPRLQKKADWRSFIPQPYKAVVILSSDFELAWAWQYAKRSKDPLQLAIQKAKQERENMPRLLKLCDEYNIPITWLTVGHLFLDSCTRGEHLTHPEIPRLPHFENNFWKYAGKDWFENDPCTDFHKDPLWYCPDLIDQILASKTAHEIGCHTFSHIDCRDVVCSPELFRKEMEAWLQASKRFGIENVTSFVHPGHTIGNLPALAEMGFTNYRTDYANILGFPHKDEHGLWEFTTTLEFDYYPDWSDSTQVKRYITLFNRALEHHTLAYLWFHPSLDSRFIKNIMPKVFDWLNRHRNEIWLVTKGEYVKWLKESGL